MDKQRFLLLYLLCFSPLAFSGAEHVHELDQLIISTPLLESTSNTALPVSILAGDELRLKAASSVGETLKNEPGISSQSFGPGVGQPVIRGQSGSRVHVLQNGLGSLDVSSLSPDHANSTEALWAERIEVLRGPSTLLYGSGAIGGVVNVLDNRIPDKAADKLISGAFEQRYNTVNEGKSSAFKLDGGYQQFAWHLDGFYRDSIEQQIPEQAVSGFDDGGRLLNSNTRAKSGTAGFSVIGDRGFIGFSANYQDNNYGVPPGDEDETVRIDMLQRRYDMKAELKDPLDFIDTVKVRLGYNDYRHVELEDGETGTVFNNEGFESRVEFIQKPWLFFDHGVVGVQTKNSEFSAIGDEAIIPKSDIDSFGFFTVQDIHTEDFTYEFGLRVEQQWIEPENLQESSHTPVSFSGSALWRVNDEDSVKLTFSRSERAPDIQELFANGEHPATSTYDLGNVGLDVEASHNIELGFHFDHDLFQLDVNLYQNWVTDYISQVNSGQFFNTVSEKIASSCAGSCLPVYNTLQKDASFQGFETQLHVPLINNEFVELGAEFFADYVRGQFSDGNDIPRMPPLRYGMQLNWQLQDWINEVRITRAEKQSYAGLNESETAGYWLLNLSSHYRVAVADHADLLFFVKANNLLDEDIRNSVSFLRASAPEAGRGAEIGFRIDF